MSDRPAACPASSLTGRCRWISAHRISRCSSRLQNGNWPNTFQSFRVTAKRADKRLPLTSMDVEREVGGYLFDVTGKSVKLKQPTLTLYIELLTNEAHVAARKVQGPAACRGNERKGRLLGSGGIDSPVAAYRMMKRGCKAVFVHFSGRPLVSRASEEKGPGTRSVADHLSIRIPTYIIPFGEIQREIVANARPPLSRGLVPADHGPDCAGTRARERCWALVTGDSLGQVASQTPRIYR